MEKGIKELSELVKMLEIVGVGLAGILKDGKVNVDDLPKVMQLVADADKIVEGVKDLGEIPAEVKDLDVDELRAVVNSMVDVYAKIKAELV